MPGPISQSYEGPTDNPPPVPPRWAFEHLDDAAYERMTLRDALTAIINEANANPHPIHFKVRAAICRARDALRYLESGDER
jgi:hypothetical protein